MLRNSRKEALAAGDPVYNTGKSCLHGHFANRYTQSGTCVICVMSAATAAKAALAPSSAPRSVAAADVRREARQATKHALSQLTEVRIRAYETDWPQVLETAIALCLAEHPALSRSDVISTRGPLDRTAGTAIYRALVPPSQATMLLEVGAAFMKRHKPDFSILDERIKQAIAMQEPQLPEWVQKP